MQDQVEDAMAQLHQGMADCRTAGAEMDRPYFAALLAEAYGQAGEVAEGLAVLDEALEQVRNSRSYFFEADLHRLKGVLHLQRDGQDSPDTAEVFFQRALEVARRQKTLSLELRAALSLSQLWQQQDRHEEALQLLEPTFDRFTEGFDTPDLVEARALLNRLHGS